LIDRFVNTFRRDPVDVEIAEEAAIPRRRGRATTSPPA